MEQVIQKLKDLWSSAWVKLAALVALVVGFLALLLQGKDEEIAALKAQVELAKTQKEADLIDSQIRQRLLTADDAAHKVKELNKALEDLQKKRQTLPEGNPEDYWKNN